MTYCSKYETFIKIVRKTETNLNYIIFDDQSIPHEYAAYTNY